jgi:hypothetical protein
MMGMASAFALAFSSAYSFYMAIKKKGFKYISDFPALQIS